MLKKCISVVLAMVMVAGLFAIVPFTASAEDLLCGDYSYVLVGNDDDGYTAEITAYYGADTELTIPAALDGYTVTAVRREAFRRIEFITSVSFPDTVTFIADYSFADCTNLANVTLPAYLEDLARASFYNCTALTKITLPSTITSCYSNFGVWSTGRGPFNGCTNLTEINFEAGFSVIPDYFFEGCPGITAMDIPATVSSIGECAFANCSNMTEIDIPDSVSSIGVRAFNGCTALTEITLPDQLATIKENTFDDCTQLKTVNMSGSVTTIKSYAFDDCSALTDIDLSGVEEIGSYAFNKCTSLSAIEIPLSLTSAGGEIFNNCSALKTVSFETGMTQIIDDLLSGCTGIEEIEIPNTVTSIGSHAFYGCTSLTKVEMTDSVETIASSAFSNCTSLNDINLSKSLTSLGDSAFYKCTSLESIELPKTLTNAGNSVYGPFSKCSALKNVTFEQGTTELAPYLFARCDGIESIVIPNTVTKIGRDAFFECGALTEVDIPDSVTEIGAYAFQSCGLLSTVTIPDNVTVIESSTFINCGSLETVDLGSGVTVIRSGAFQGCTSLSELTLSDSLENIEGYAFRGCDSLETITIPANLANNTNSRSPIFYECPNLKTVIFESGSTRIPEDFISYSGVEEVVIPNTVTAIESSAFYRCESLKTIDIPGSVETIGSQAFGQCTSLEEIEIPASVTVINGSTFNRCTALESITFKGNVTEIKDYAFYNCDALTEVTLPSTVSRLGSNAFANCDELESVNIPKALCDEGGSASSPFKECPKLDNITFENGITAIPDFLFNQCTGLTAIAIPETVTSIGSYAFNQCPNLKDVNLPHALETLGSCAFANCTSIESVVIPKTLTSSEHYSLSGCSSLSDITLEQGLETIPANLFDGCNGFETIVIPSSVTTIGRAAFHNSSLKTIDIPDTVTTIESSAFYGSKLERVTIPDSITVIREYVFKECTNLISVDLGASVTEIGLDAFGNCGSLETVISRAEDVTNISSLAFRNDASATFYAPHSAVTLRDYVRNTLDDNKFIGTDAHDDMTWTWDGFTSAALTISCERCDLDEYTIDAVIDSELTLAPTCTEDGERLYTATATLVGDYKYTDQKTEAVPATGHHYGQPEWTWNGYGTAYASFTCAERDDTQNVNATITSEVTTPATCTTDGLRTYTATVTFEDNKYTSQSTEVIPATGHNYGAPEWIWVNFSTAVAGFSCAEGDDEQFLNAQISSEITTPATCTSAGVRTYTAEVTFEDKTYTSKVTEVIPAKGHSYGAPEWTWSGNSMATVSFTCGVCGDVHTETADIDIKTTKEPTVTKTGFRTYTATVVFEGETYIDIKTEVLPKLLFAGHSLSYNGDLNVTVFFNMTEEQAQTASVDFEWGENTLENAPLSFDSGTGCYTATCTVAFEDISEEVYIIATVGAKTEVESFTYGEYADTVLTDESFISSYKAEYGEQAYDQLAAFVTKLENGEKISTVLGDADGDGKISVRDVTAIQRALADIQPDADGMLTIRANVTGGALTIDDATQLQRYLAEFDTEFDWGDAATANLPLIFN